MENLQRLATLNDGDEPTKVNGSAEVGKISGAHEGILRFPIKRGHY